MAASRNYSSTAGLMHLAGDITAAAASLIVDTVTGLPTAPFTLLLDPGLTSEEVVEVTAAGGTTLTVTRGVDGTSAQAHTNGAEVRHAYSARDFQDSRNHEANTTTAHGVTGAVVGTTSTQTLTGKTVDGAVNTFTNVPSAAVTGLDAHVANTTTAHGVTGAVAGTTNVQTLTNKTMSGADNTFSAIPSAAVVGLDTHTAATAAHGASGSVVGTTNTQTLTNKTLTAPTLTGVTTAATINATAMTVAGKNVLHTEAGSVSHTYSGGVGSVSTVITFAVPFAVAPSVTLGCSTFTLQVEYGSLTATGFTLFSKGFNDVVPVSASYNLSWNATGA